MSMDETFGRPTGDKLTISKQARKIHQMKETIEQLHERLAAVQSSKKNKASQVARLKKILRRWHVCEYCGEVLEPSPSADKYGNPIYYVCGCANDILARD